MQKTITRYIPLFILILTAIGLPIAFILVNQSQDIRQRAAASIPVTPTPPQQTTLSFNSSSDPNELILNQTFTVELVLETPLPVTAAQTTINFDPKKLEVISVSLDGNFNQPSLLFSPSADITKANISNSGGTIEYTVINPPNFTPNTGYGSIGEIVFKTKDSASNTYLNYNIDQNSYIALTALSAKGSGSTNVLEETKSLTFTISSSSDTPTPTSIPILTPTPTPTTTSIYDLNHDGTVDILDYSIFVEQFINPPTTNPSADFDGDNDVDIFDYNLFVENFGHTTITPSPTTNHQSCNTNSDCPTNQICYQPPTPTCSPNQLCSQAIPDKYCLLSTNSAPRGQ